MASRTLVKKLKRVESLIKTKQRVMVALSGGIDSNLLLAIAQRIIPDRVLAITVSSPFCGPDEIMQAQRLARELGVKHIVTQVLLLRDKKIAANNRDRCYRCKRRMLNHIRSIAKKHQATVMDASNYSDTRDFRPGLRALKELKIISPFIVARVTKPEIRTLAKKYRLAAWNKPANACLATRIPYGIRITPRILKRIHQAETYLHHLGFSLVRVRDHSLIVRIEMLPEDFPRFIRFHAKIARYFKRLGFKYPTLDLQGYRTGSLN
ncbi:ATP-dependent sacrificial sulfur transferase LarE [candidate division WOR-3 bacterium]|nr:ATP-dependent sacrificial sulfur transferase LarE [candidate division WOR-3 bacterium]